MEPLHIPYAIGPATGHHSLGYWQQIWKKCRDVLAGEEAIKEAGEEYLPRMARMTEDLYQGYKARAMFYGASQRTLSGLIGSLLRKPPIIYYSKDSPPIGAKEDKEDALKRHVAAQEQADKTKRGIALALRNITQTGQDLQGFTRDLVYEVLAVGRVGVLVDAPPADSRLLDPVPYARMYTAEHILNWREHFEGGVPVLDQVVLVEQLFLPGVDGFGVEAVTQYRELTLNEDGSYIQRVWVIDPPLSDEDMPSPRVLEEVTPLYRGKPLKRLPFFFCSASHQHPAIERPPLLDLFNVNLSHYRSSADLEHGRHFTALPTPVVSGVDAQDDGGMTPSLEIGSSTAWLLPLGATARMLEFNGAGLKHLENALIEKSALMTNLGARMLEPDKRSAETAEALRLRQAGDIASLNIIADTMGDVLTDVVRLIAWWSGLTTEFADDGLFVQLDKDYFESRLTPTMLTSLVAAWQQGAMSFRDLYYNLVRGETIDADRPYEDVHREVQEEIELRAKAAAAQALALSKATAAGNPSTATAPATPGGTRPGQAKAGNSETNRLTEKATNN